MFSPHHQFRNCTKLEEVVDKFHRDSNINDDVFQEYKKYHFSFIHKLKSAKTYIEDLTILLTNTSPEEIVRESSEFPFEVNHLIDGFFYSSGSALDILAREILIYNNIPLPDRMYFHTAKSELVRLKPGDSLILKLDNINWKQEFSDYRNALTHELLIAGQYSIDVIMDGSTQKTSIVYPLPDNPRMSVLERTFTRNRNVLDYCNITFRRILTLSNVIYSEILNKINTAGSIPF